MDAETKSHLHETPWVVTVPLVLLAIPSVLIGWPTIGPMLVGDFFTGSITVLPEQDALADLRDHWHGPFSYFLHSFYNYKVPAVWLALAGVGTAWYTCLKRPELGEQIGERLSGLRTVLVNKYYFDEVYQRVFAGGAQGTGKALWRIGDEAVIDGALVNGTARSVGWIAGVVRHVQSGYLYHYAFAMVIGLAVLLGWFIMRGAG